MSIEGQFYQVRLRSGGEVVLQLWANALALSAYDREFVFTIVDYLREYEMEGEGVPRPSSLVPRVESVEDIAATPVEAEMPATEPRITFEQLGQELGISDLHRVGQPESPGPGSGDAWMKPATVGIAETRTGIVASNMAAEEEAAWVASMKPPRMVAREPVKPAVEAAPERPRLWTCPVCEKLIASSNRGAHELRCGAARAASPAAEDPNRPADTRGQKRCDRCGTWRPSRWVAKHEQEFKPNRMEQCACGGKVVQETGGGRCEGCGKHTHRWRLSAPAGGRVTYTCKGCGHSEVRSDGEPEPLSRGHSKEQVPA